MSESKSREDFDRKAEEWDRDPARIQRASAIAEALISKLTLNSDMRVMDFGAGTGMLTLKLLPHVGSVTAVDNSKGMLAVFEKKLRQRNIDSVDILLIDIYEQELPKSQYDLLVSAMTMHHIRDISRALNQMYGALVEGGRIAIADLEREPGDFHSDPDVTVHHGFNREEFKSFIAGAGFSSINDEIIYTIRKTVKSGREKDFPVFLVTAVK